MDNARPSLELMHFKTISTDANGTPLSKSQKGKTDNVMWDLEVPVIAVFTKFDQFKRDIRMKLADEGRDPEMELDDEVEEKFKRHYLGSLWPPGSPDSDSSPPYGLPRSPSLPYGLGSPYRRPRGYGRGSPPRSRSPSPPRSRISSPRSRNPSPPRSRSPPPTSPELDGSYDMIEMTHIPEVSLPRSPSPPYRQPRRYGYGWGLGLPRNPTPPRSRSPSPPQSRNPSPPRSRRPSPTSPELGGSHDMIEMTHIPEVSLPSPSPPYRQFGYGWGLGLPRNPSPPYRQSRSPSPPYRQSRTPPYRLPLPMSRGGSRPYILLESEDHEFVS